MTTMTSTADRLLREVLALPVDERADLFRRLKQALPHEADEVAPSSPDEFTAAWVEVALERLERHARGESGPTKSIDEVEQVLAESLRAL